ncbi:MAG: DUF7507 domain-containing protein [Gaiellaceae bacterium]
MSRSGGPAFRLRRALGWGLLALAAGLLLAPPALGASLPPSDEPLDGSSFQGADGNQGDDAPLIDWQRLQAAGDVRHTADANDEDTAFTAGSKEDEPGEWDLRVEIGGVKPSKANILDAWSAVDQNGADTFVYLAFASASELILRDAGTTFLTFELNHDARLWDNGQAMIPCRRTDDILVSYEPQGNRVDVVLRRWISEADDPATGCSTRGHLDALSGLTPNVDAQGAMNRAAITNYLPGFYNGSIPIERFGEAALNLSQILEDALGNECFSFASIWMHSRSSTAEESNMQDYVAPHALTARSCSASGTKFHDLDADGRRDRGEPGLPRWIIWADYDDDGIRDAAEPFGITDAGGHYVINDIRPPDGTYMLRETLSTELGLRRARLAGVTCSYPNDSTPGGTGSAPGGLFHCGWGPIPAAATTYARFRDFGNYVPATLVVKKQLEPSSDPGRFDLLVNRTVVIAGAGDGATRGRRVPPGAYTVSEVAAAGTNPANYRSTVECKVGTRRTQVRSGSVYADLRLRSGQLAVCTFRNVRLGSPAIAIDKVGPASATAGDTLHYQLFVKNPGDLPFPAASVRVVDPNCDPQPPTLVGKADAAGADDTPRTLDPGDVWTYSCSKKTVAPEDCRPSVVTNTAVVTGEAGGSTVRDDSRVDTALTCPPEPPEPIEPPSPPSPVVPPGPPPPDADNAAAAGAVFRPATSGCIRGRVPRVNLQGTRISRVRVFVNDRLVRRLTVRTLQWRLTPRVTLPPGRYRLRVRVTFQRGTGSPAVLLQATIRICSAARAARPPFTG